MARKDGKDRGLVFKNNVWWCRIYAHGQEKWFRCENKSQAKVLYGRLRADLREGTYFPKKVATSHALTLRAWIHRCLAGSTNANLVNEKIYGRRWSHWFGKRLLTQLTTEALRRHQAKLRDKMKRTTHTPHPQRRWADATINRHFGFLRHILTLALRDGQLTRNPVSGVKFFPESTRTRYLTDTELRALRQQLTPEQWALVALAIETGLRRAEQFRLRWECVDLEQGVLTIPMPKGGRTRHVPLSDAARALFQSLPSWGRSPWVFPAPHHLLQPWNPHSFVTRIYAPALRQAGVHGACWHSLRHTAASRRVMAGVDLVSVMAILGHRTIQTTMRYSHVSPTHLRQAVNRGSLGDPHGPLDQPTPLAAPAARRDRALSPLDVPRGTGSRTGSGAPHAEPAPAGLGAQVADGLHETTWGEEEEVPRMTQVKNPKSKQTPIVRFLDKEYPHC